jgi:prevent-host-death family protein
MLYKIHKCCNVSQCRDFRDRGKPLKTYPINEARAHLSELVERALAGEPQRVTRYGKEAVVIVSEREWRTRTRAAPTLGALLARYARAGRLDEDITDRPWTERPLGNDLG